MENAQELPGVKKSKAVADDINTPMGRMKRRKVTTLLCVCGRTVEVVLGRVKNKARIQDHVDNITALAASNEETALKKQVADLNKDIAELQAKLKAAK